MVNKPHIYHGIVKNSRYQVVHSEVFQTHSWSQFTLQVWISCHLLLLCVSTLQADEFRSDIIHRISIIFNLSSLLCPHDFSQLFLIFKSCGCVTKTHNPNIQLENLAKPFCTFSVAVILQKDIYLTINKISLQTFHFSHANRWNAKHMQNPC